MKPTKDRRADIRIPLISEKYRVISIGLYDDSTFYYDQVLDVDNVSSGGMFFKTKELPKAGVTVRVMMNLPGDLGLFTLDGKVCRVSWTSSKKTKAVVGFAIRFFELSIGQQKIWDAYRTYLRNKQIINVSKRIIEEFFGSKGPKGFQ